MKTVEILFHDSTTRALHLEVYAVVHGLSAVTLYCSNGDTFTYPWINVQRLKEVDA